MKSRWLSSFTVIGIILVILGIAGFIWGTRFVFDPGQPATGREPLFYLIIGIIMIVNGLMTPPSIADETTLPVSRSSQSAANTNTVTDRNVVAAEKSTGDS